MTNAEALDLLELDAARAGDVRQLRDAHARRCRQLQAQLRTATAAPVRAAYEETLEAVDVALAVLLKAATPAKLAAPPPPPAQATPPPDPASRGGSAAAGTTATGERAGDWIAATPWNALRHEPGDEFRSPEEAAPAPNRPAAPAATPRTPARQPTALPKPTGAPPLRAAPAARATSAPAPARTPPRAAEPPMKRPPVAMTMSLPDSVFDGPRRTRAGAPPAPLSVRLARQEEPAEKPVPEPPRRIGRIEREPAPARSWSVVPFVAILLLVAAASLAGWAWQNGTLEHLAARIVPSVTTPGGNRLAAGEGVNPRPQPPPQTQDTRPLIDEEPSPEVNLSEERQAAIQEIERSGTELMRLAGQLQGAVGVDWKQELAEIQRLPTTGETDEAAQRLARLQDTLRAQITAAGEVLTARQRLSNAGLMTADTPLAQAAADYVASLADQADRNVAEGDYPAAAESYELALDARLRLPRDIDGIETARKEAATQDARVRQALDELDSQEVDSGELAATLERAAELEAGGAAVEAWLSAERPGAELAEEFEALGTTLRETAGRLEQVITAREQMQASTEALEQVESEIHELAPRAEQLASWREGDASLGENAREGVAAMRAGRIAEAVTAYEAAAAEAAVRLEAAVHVRDLLKRRAAAAEQLTQAMPAAEQRLAQLETQLASLASTGGADAAETTGTDLAARVAADRRHLVELASPALAELPEDPAALEAHVEQAEVRSQAFLTLAPAVEALAAAEHRLLLLEEIILRSGQPEQPVEDVVELPLAPALVARRALAQISGAEERPTQEDVAAVHRTISEAQQATIAAAAGMARPAAEALRAELAAKQETYRRRFGAVDLERAWQPADPPANVVPPSELAAPVAAALAAEVDVESLGRALSSGGAEAAESVLQQIRTLERANSALEMLREVAEREGEGGFRQIHHSAAAGDIAKVEALLALGVTPAPRCEDGRTPVGMALAKGHLEVAGRLLEAGGRPPGWMEAGRPLLFAVAGSPESLQLLLKHGAPVRDLHRGETALHALAWQSNREQVPTGRQLASARILLDAGVDVTARNRSAQTAAELAASLGLNELADLLLDPDAARGRP